MENAILSPAAQVIVAIIPIVGIVFGGLIVFFYLLWRHRQITLQIKMSTYVNRNFDLSIFSLLTGILLTGIGFILTIIIGLVENLSYALLGGLLPLIIGISLIIFYMAYSKTLKKEHLD